MTSPERPQPVVPVALVWAAVAGLGILVAGLVALYALAPGGSKPDLAPLFGALVAGIVAGVPALAAWLRGRRNTAIVAQHGQTLAKIDRQTNGQLDARIISAVGQAIDSRPALVSQAVVEQGLAAVLASHLDDAGRHASSQAAALAGAPVAPSLDLTPDPQPAPAAGSTPTPEGPDHDQ